MPVPDGSCPVTLAPVRIVIPRFWNDRTTTLATSASQPGRIFGRNSRMVTLAPRSENVEANSHPMAPPPITTSDDGSSVRRTASRLVQ